MEHNTYTGRGLKHTDDRRAYNLEARRLDWPMRVCEFCGLEAGARCSQTDGGAPGWYENGGTVSCGPCRRTEWVSGAEIRTAKRGLSDNYFGPGEDIR